jgi:hypothetical protein
MPNDTLERRRAQERLQTTAKRSSKENGRSSRRKIDERYLNCTFIFSKGGIIYLF